MREETLRFHLLRFKDEIVLRRRSKSSHGKVVKVEELELHFILPKFLMVAISCRGLQRLETEVTPSLGRIYGFVIEKNRLSIFSLMPGRLFLCRKLTALGWAMRIIRYPISALSATKYPTRYPHGISDGYRIFQILKKHTNYGAKKVIF